jgi:hypothetical protein
MPDSHFPSSGSGAPTDATYITQTANGSLSAEQAIGALSSGILRGATTTGVITSLGDTLPVANGGTGLTGGTSGGVLAYSAAGTIVSSGALTANLPVIGGGAGVAPGVGTRSGSTTAFVTTTGTQTSGDCVKIDASGNHIANGSACGGGITVGDTQVLFADGANTPAGDAGMTYAKTTDTLTLAGNLVLSTSVKSVNVFEASGGNTFGFAASPATRSAVITNGAGLELGELASGDGGYFGILNGSNPNGGIRWHPGSLGTAADTALARNAAGILEINKGTAGTAIGEYLVSGALTSVTSTSANSCGTTSPTIGANSLNSAGFFTVGATSGTNCTLTFSVAAPHLWNCDAQDETTANLMRSVRKTTTTVEIQGVMVAGDVIAYKCKPY